MKHILTFIKLYRPWLILLQLAGFFSFYSTSSVGFGLFIMLVCSMFTAILIRILPNKNLYYIYNLGYSFKFSYAIVALLNIALFGGLASIVNLINYA